MLLDKVILDSEQPGQCDFLSTQRGRNGVKVYLGSSFHDAHHLATPLVSDDSNGVFVNRVERDEFGAFILIPESVLVLITLRKHLHGSNTNFTPCSQISML